MLRSFEARDRNLAELNYSRVGVLSMLIIVTMISVAFLQAFLIKSLFETGNKKTVWSESVKLFNKLYNSFWDQSKEERAKIVILNTNNWWEDQIRTKDDEEEEYFKVWYYSFPFVMNWKTKESDDK